MKQKTIFSTLGEVDLLRLAAETQIVRVGVGETIHCGKDAGIFYVLLGGAAELTGRSGPVALGPGDLFGEGALLLDGLQAEHPPEARATAPCQVLVISREAMLRAMRADGRVAGRVFELLRLRRPPRRAPGVTLHRREDGAGGAILKDAGRERYFRLSEEGVFVWGLLDGRRTARSLLLAHFEEFGSFAPQAVLDLLERLAAEGFVREDELIPEAAAIAQSLGRGTASSRLFSGARRVLDWQVSLRGVDAPLSRLYAGGVGLLYTRAAQVVLALVVLAGLVAFISGIGGFGAALSQTQAGGWLLLFWIPATVLAIVLHESGHAFTTKHFGRNVPRVGVGWYWFGPIAYVDTSDMWLERRRPRIAVSLAGPYTDLVTGSATALAAWLVPGDVASVVLWQFALISYIDVLFNLDPLMEFDGYYVLIDLLDKPNLRPDALAWLGNELPGALRDPSKLKGHRLELLYGLGSVLYIGFMAVLTVVLYRLTVQDWLAGALSEGVAAGAAWFLAAGVVLLVSAGVLSELRGARAGKP